MAKQVIYTSQGEFANFGLPEGASEIEVPQKLVYPKNTRDRVIYAYTCWNEKNILSQITWREKDTSGRGYNFLAHHLLLNAQETLTKAGPAWLLQHKTFLNEETFLKHHANGTFDKKEGLEASYIDAKDDYFHVPLKTWKLLGHEDVGHEKLKKSIENAEDGFIIFDPDNPDHSSNNLLALFYETLSYVDVEKRWNITFSSYSSGVDHRSLNWNWVCLAKTDEENIRYYEHHLQDKNNVIDLTEGQDFNDLMMLELSRNPLQGDEIAGFTMDWHTGNDENSQCEEQDTDECSNIFVVEDEDPSHLTTHPESPESTTQRQIGKKNSIPVGLPPLSLNATTQKWEIHSRCVELEIAGLKPKLELIPFYEWTESDLPKLGTIEEGKRWKIVWREMEWLHISLNGTKIQTKWVDGVEKKNENIDYLLFSTFRFFLETKSDVVEKTEERKYCYQLLDPGTASSTLSSPSPKELYANLSQVVAEILLVRTGWLRQPEYQNHWRWVLPKIRRCKYDIAGFNGSYLFQDKKMFLLVLRNSQLPGGVLDGLEGANCTIYLENERGIPLILFQ